MNKGFLYLMLSVLCDPVWNFSLKASKGFADWKVNVPGLIFLGLGIISFKLALNSLSLSVATVIWSGATLLLTILVDMYFFKTRIDYRTALFMILCFVSIIGLNYFSGKK